MGGMGIGSDTGSNREGKLGCGRGCGDGIRSDKSSLDKPHLFICDEAAAGALSEPSFAARPYAFPHGAGFGIF